MNDYLNFYTQSNEKTIVDGKKAFNIHLGSIEGFDAKIDGVSVRVVKQNHSNSTANPNDEKYVMCLSNINLKLGSLMEVNENGIWVNYIVTTSSIDNSIYKSAMMTKTTHVLNVYKNTILLEVPCIVSNNSNTGSTNNTPYIELPQGQINVTVPNNEDTRTITYNQIYNIGLSNYKVIHINDTKQLGLIIFTMELVSDKIPESIEEIHSVATSNNCEITFIGLSQIKIGGSVKSFNAVFKSETGVVLNNITAIWDLIIPIGFDDYITTEITNNIIKIKALDNSSFIGKIIRLTVTGGNMSSYLDIKVVKLI